MHTLWKYGIPTGTVELKGALWIVVNGVSTDVEPVPGSSYSINGFWINNPEPGLYHIKPPLASGPTSCLIKEC